MNTFYIVTNDAKDSDFQVTEQIKRTLENAGKTCILCQKNSRKKIEPSTIPADIDCVIVIGGDGSLIEIARLLRGREVPILGINMGTLGYLTEVEVGDLDQALQKIIDGTYTLEDRMMLEGVFEDGRKNVALNEVILSRKEAVRPIHFKLYVNGEFLNSYESDGMIVATPTGSTAYNLSAGGPIVEPAASLIVATPICSHALDTSSLVLSAEDEIVMEIAEGKNGKRSAATVAFDGKDPVTMVTGDRLRVHRAKSVTRVVKVNTMSFLELLRRKMKG